MCLHLKLLDIDNPLIFEVSKLRQIEAHAVIYLRRYKALISGMTDFAHLNDYILLEIYKIVKSALYMTH